MDMNSKGTGLVWDFTNAFWSESTSANVAQFVQDGQSAEVDYAGINASRVSATYQDNAQLQPSALLCQVAIRF